MNFKLFLLTARFIFVLNTIFSLYSTPTGASSCSPELSTLAGWTSSPPKAHTPASLFPNYASNTLPPASSQPISGSTPPTYHISNNRISPVAGLSPAGDRQLRQAQLTIDGMKEQLRQVCHCFTFFEH